MAPVLLYLLSMFCVTGGRRLFPRARRDPLSQLQQQPIEQSKLLHTSPHHNTITHTCTHTSLIQNLCSFTTTSERSLLRHTHGDTGTSARNYEIVLAVRKRSQQTSFLNLTHSIDLSLTTIFKRKHKCKTLEALISVLFSILK